MTNIPALSPGCSLSRPASTSPCKCCKLYSLLESGWDFRQYFGQFESIRVAFTSYPRLIEVILFTQWVKFFCCIIFDMMPRFHPLSCSSTSAECSRRPVLWSWDLLCSWYGQIWRSLSNSLRQRSSDVRLTIWYPEMKNNCICFVGETCLPISDRDYSLLLWLLNLLLIPRWQLTMLFGIGYKLVALYRCILLY